MKKNSAFTLIELLVVIAIIGILSSVVLASVNTARAKGADAAIKANLANIRAQAESYYDTNGHYGTAAFTEASPCAATASTLFADSVIFAQITAAGNASTGNLSSTRCSSSIGAGAAWAASVTLKQNTANAWCVDSTGRSVQVAAGDAGIASSACVPN